MPTPRLPAAKAQVSGAAAKNPQRFRDRKGPTRTRPLGEPYANMTDEQKAAWHDIAKEAPWLHSSHRTVMRLASMHVAKLHSGEDLGLTATSILLTMLGKLGLTPSEESKVNHGDGGEDDSDDSFFSRKSQ